MSRQDAARKFVIIVNETLPAGLAANTCAVLSATVAGADQSFIGPDVTDASGSVHPGITALPIPILRASPATLSDIRKQAEKSGLFCAGFTRTAQTCHDYAQYIQRMALTDADELEYSGLALYGDAGTVGGLTGSLPLMR